MMRAGKWTACCSSAGQRSSTRRAAGPGPSSTLGRFASRFLSRVALFCGELAARSGEVDRVGVGAAAVVAADFHTDVFRRSLRNGETFRELRLALAPPAGDGL